MVTVNTGTGQGGITLNTTLNATDYTYVSTRPCTRHVCKAATREVNGEITGTCVHCGESVLWDFEFPALRKKPAAQEVTELMDVLFSGADWTTTHMSRWNQALQELEDESEEVQLVKSLATVARRVLAQRMFGDL